MDRLARVGVLAALALLAAGAAWRWQTLGLRGTHSLPCLLAIVAGTILTLLVALGAERSGARRLDELRRSVALSRRLDDRFLELTTSQYDLASHAAEPDALRLLAADRALRLTDADDARIWLSDGAGLYVASAVGRFASSLHTRIPLARNLVAFAFHSVALVSTGDAQADDREDRAAARRSGIRSMIAVPIMLGNEAIGVLSVSHAEADRFDAVALETVKMLAAQLTTALMLADEKRRTRESMALQQATLDAIEAGVVYYDAFGAVADANASASRLLRGRLELIADKRFADGTHLDEQGASVDFGRTFLRPTLIDRIPRLNFVVGIRLTENEVVWVTMYVRPVQHERYAAIASFTDVTLFKRDAERQRQIAEHDPLTGLANTKSWRRRVENAIELAKTTERNFGVVYVDLDGFKEVNDTLGHAFGDEALLVAASRMRGAMKSDDVLARLGGDEFAALVFYENGDEFVAARAGIASAFQSPIVVRDRTLDLRASIGMAAFPADGASVDALLEVSDSRMYANKARNRKR